MQRKIKKLPARIKSPVLWDFEKTHFVKGFRHVGETYKEIRVQTLHVNVIASRAKHAFRIRNKF